MLCWQKEAEPSARAASHVKSAFLVGELVVCYQPDLVLGGDISVLGGYTMVMQSIEA